MKNFRELVLAVMIVYLPTGHKRLRKLLKRHWGAWVGLVVGKNMVRHLEVKTVAKISSIIAPAHDLGTLKGGSEGGREGTGREETPLYWRTRMFLKSLVYWSGK